MKLLNCETRQIEDFSDRKIPDRYAILSHRWEDDEVTHQDFRTPELAAQKAGWEKIDKFCRVALDNSYKHVWIDTCCINKEDLTELTEAINSMFKWYANSAVCHTYLSDITLGQPIEDSLWFTRGWTLQELIAPARMEFFDKHWKRIGTRFQLREAIQRCTRIGDEILDETLEARNISTILARNSVARKMSWAAGRETTREEDRAYSLLGIFNVNMPLLYGEGSRAFVRLQEEIAKESNDLSLLAWRRYEWPSNNLGPQSTKRPGLPREPCGVLAISPDDFRSSHDVILRRGVKYNPEFTVTNKGLKITTQATVIDGNVWRIALGCRAVDSSPQDTIGVLLRGVGGGEFVRWNSNSRIQWRGDSQGHDMTFYIKKSVDLDTSEMMISQLESMFHRSFQFHANAKSRVKFGRALPALNWITEQNLFVTEGLESFEGFVTCEFCDPTTAGISLPSFVVACGFGPGVKRWVCIGSAKGANRGLFKAAEEGDLHQVGVLGAKASRSKKSSLVVGYNGHFEVKDRKDNSDIMDISVYI